MAIQEARQTVEYLDGDPNEVLRPEPSDADKAQMQICRLCGAYDAHERPGRLGRYALTCNSCESRRGTHLATDGRGAAMQFTHQLSHWRR